MLVASAYVSALAGQWIRECAAQCPPADWPAERERIANAFETAIDNREMEHLAATERFGLSAYLAARGEVRILTFAADDKPRLEIPPSWSAPAAGAVQAIITKCADPDVPDDVLLDTIDRTVGALPSLIEEVDWRALSDIFEASMGQAVVRAALQHPGGDALTALAAETAGPATVAFAPIAEAVDKLDRKTPVTSMLTSEEWAAVPVQLRERAQFSARVESARFMATVQDKLLRRLELEVEQLENGKQAFVDRDSFIRDMRALAEEEGLETTDEAGRGTVRDIRSVQRLGLIYDMQTQSAAGYARHKMDQYPAILDEWPAQRLGPSTAVDPRGDAWWMSRWREAGGAVGWRGALRNDFVALKTSSIWSELSEFKVPWPPFDYGSTRDLVDVDRDEAISIGLIQADEPVSPDAVEEQTFNAGLEARVDDLPEALVLWLRDSFGDQVRIVEGVLRWVGTAA